MDLDFCSAPIIRLHKVLANKLRYLFNKGTLPCDNYKVLDLVSACYLVIKLIHVRSNAEAEPPRNHWKVNKSDIDTLHLMYLLAFSRELLKLFKTITTYKYPL